MIEQYLHQFNIFIKNALLIAIDFSKQKAVDVDPRAMQDAMEAIELLQEIAENADIAFILKDIGKNILDFSKSLVRVL